MADSSKKIVTFDLLEQVKKYIDANDSLAIKSVDFADNTLKFYTTTNMSGNPVKTISLPEEYFLDQTKTTLVNEFAWSADTYPNSADPDLDGKPVFVLAVKGDTSVKYSFVSMDAIFEVYTGDTTDSVVVEVSEDNKISASVKISNEEGNIATVKEDGIYVPESELEYATKEDIVALFRTETTTPPDDTGDEDTDNTEDESTT